MSIADMARHEQIVAARLVDELLWRGLPVSVFDGEAYSVKDSTSREEIFEALCSTEEDVVAAGSFDFWLVYGNDAGELISDYGYGRDVDEFDLQWCKMQADKIFDHACDALTGVTINKWNP
jgi:hypothetical protein